MMEEEGGFPKQTNAHGLAAHCGQHRVARRKSKGEADARLAAGAGVCASV